MRATIFFLTFVVFIAAVVWRVDQVMFGDKLAWGEAQSRAQMSAIAHALETEVQSLKDILFLSFSEVEAGKKDFSSHRPYSQFQMMAKLLPPNKKEDRKDWQVISTFFQENSPTKNWATPYVTLALKSIKEDDVRQVNVFTLMDPSRKPYLLLMTRAGANWYAGLLGTEVFQGLMDRQKGQKSTFFVVNLQGQALGHTTQEYIGSLLTEDPLVAELMKSSVGNGFGIFPDLKGDSVQGLYEQVENTNVYAVITTPLASLAENRDKVRWQLVLMGAGLALIGLAIFVYFDRGSVGGGMVAAKSLPPSITPGAPVPVSISSGNIPTGADRMKAYTQVASSLSHELKTPLSSILGHTQLLINQINDGAAIGHLHKIESEARSARELVQKLLIFSGEDKVATQKMGLETVLNKALKHVEGKIISKGIKLSKNIQSVPQFTMAGDLVVKAVENVLLNAIEAMERAPKKELTVELKADGPSIELSIVDSGEGISQADLGKVFDPFFTTRSGSQHVGLGLSTALGIFKEAFGEVHVDSEKGKGTSVKVIFNPQENLLATPSQAEVPKTAPKAPPQAAAPMAPPEVANKPAPPAFVAPPESDLIPLDPLLVDNTIERLIEDDLPDMPPPPSEDLVFEPAPAPAAPNPLPTAAPQASVEKPAPPSFSAKIDKPKIEIKKKSSRLDEMQVSVRRPGERT